MKRWFLTVDWCDKGKRGVFSDVSGNSFSKETQHTVDEMQEIFGVFFIILNPQSVEMSEGALKEYHKYYPLAEYSYQYGVVHKD